MFIFKHVFSFCYTYLLYFIFETLFECNKITIIDLIVIHYL